MYVLVAQDSDSAALSLRVCEMCFVIYEVYQERKKCECDTHHTRSIKTNSGVDLSRKPGLDLCCDLLQRLQGVVPRTCSF